MKKIENVKKAMCDVATRTAKNSVGKSIPIGFHEPKIPQGLKKLKK